MRLITGLLTVLVSCSALADKQFYVKDGATFKPVTKREATVALLNNSAPVFTCAEQRLSDKMTIKSKASD